MQKPCPITVPDLDGQWFEYIDALEEFAPQHMRSETSVTKTGRVEQVIARWDLPTAHSALSSLIEAGEVLAYARRDDESRARERIWSLSRFQLREILPGVLLEGPGGRPRLFDPVFRLAEPDNPKAVAFLREYCDRSKIVTARGAKAALEKDGRYKFKRERFQALLHELAGDKLKKGPGRPEEN